MITAVHELNQPLLERLGTGAGGEPAIRALYAAQVSKHLQLIGYLLEHWPGPAPERDAITEALDRARQRSPERFQEVVGAPLVGGWAAITARALGRGRPVPVDFAHLAALAAAACAATGADAEVEVPVRDGFVALPGLGTAAVGAADRARVTVSGGHLTVRAGSTSVEVPVDGGESPGLLRVRRLTAEATGMRLSLGLDDLDPYRHGHHVPPAPRLPEAEVDRWRELFDGAWELLAGHVPDRAAELVAGLRTLVPLVRTEEHSARSATIRHAFGVFGLTRPATAAEFCVTIVHEFQHSKLSAILDLAPMCDPSDDRRYFAPWRADPRPLPGLLQGVYAFVGVADTWRALRAVDDIALAAEQEFASARRQVHAGLTAVEQSGALTPAGHVLAAHLRQTTEALLAEPVRPAAERLAEQAFERTRHRWLERNGVPDAG